MVERSYRSGEKFLKVMERSYKWWKGLISGEKFLKVMERS